MTSMGTPAVSSACSTPRCASPRLPPPLSTRPTALPAIHLASRAMSCGHHCIKTFESNPSDPIKQAICLSGGVVVRRQNSSSAIHTRDLPCQASRHHQARR